jgi:hypothetical protein
VLVDHLKEDGRAGGGRECAELPCDGSAHAHLNVTHRRVLPVRRHARTDGATGKTIENIKSRLFKRKKFIVPRLHQVGIGVAFFQ